MDNICIACGRYMVTTKQHAMGDGNKPYCVSCARPDGSMQSYAEKFKAMTNYYLSTEQMDRSTAMLMAQEHLSLLPAWSKQIAA